MTESEITLADVTTLNVSSTAHGLTPKAPADATKFLNGAATPAFAQVKGSDLSMSDVTTNNVSTSMHGFAPKLPNDATKYLDGTGAYSVPAGGGAGAVTEICDQLLSGTQASFDTNTILGGNISGSYKHLRFESLLRCSGATNNMWVRLNNDSTGGDYVYEQRFTGGPTSAANSTFGSSTDTGVDPSAGTMPGSGQTAGYFAGLTVTIWDYASTTAMKIMDMSMVCLFAASRIYTVRTAAVLLSTSAVTRITLLPQANSWAAGSRFTLYGLS